MSTTHKSRSLISIDGFQGSRLDADYVQKLRQGGVGAFFSSVSDSHQSLRETMTRLLRFRKFVTESSDLLFCTSASEIERAVSAGRIGILATFQDSYCLGYDVDIVELFYALGVRMVQLTANDRNFVGDGCGEPANAGLSKAGKRLVRLLNQLGILIDLSHVGDATRRNALELSDSPVVFSHGNARGYCDNVRNVADEDIRLLAKRGGVIGATTYPTLCSWEKNPTIDTFIDNISYMVDLAGVDHVGLGLGQIEGLNIDNYLKKYPEMYGVDAWPEGVESVTAWPAILQKLSDRGYGAEDIAKIAGGNFLRVYRQVLDGRQS